MERAEGTGTSATPYVRLRMAGALSTFKRSNLHVINYSVPIHATMSLADLKPHLFSILTKPDLIPYRTSYYQKTGASV